MDLLLLCVIALLLWQAEKRWHPMKRLLEILNRHTGVSLPLVALCYTWALVPTVLINFRHRSPQHWHAGAAEFSAMLLTALVVLVVLPVSVYDILKKKWYGAFSVPLSFGIYFVLISLFQFLYDSGRVVLEE